MKKIALFFSFIIPLIAYDEESMIGDNISPISEIQSANHYFSSMEGYWLVRESSHPSIKTTHGIEIGHSKKFYFAGENCYTVSGIGLNIYPSEVTNSTSTFDKDYSARVYKKGFVSTEGYWVVFGENQNKLHISKMERYRDGRLKDDGFSHEWCIILERMLLANEEMV